MYCVDTEVYSETSAPSFQYMPYTALLVEDSPFNVADQCNSKFWHAMREACPCEGAGDFEVIGLDLNRAPHLAQPWALGPVLTAQTPSMHTKECLTICLKPLSQKLV